MQVLWFKRDLRVTDHAALSAAAVNGPLIPLYVIEPDLWAQPDMSARQYQFMCDSVAYLSSLLESIGQRLIVQVGEVHDVFLSLHQQYKLNCVWSHEETGNLWTYKRDTKLKQWMKKNAITWHEFAQNGVIRGLKNRDGWSMRWYLFMQKDTLPAPAKLESIHESSDTIPSLEAMGWAHNSVARTQRGGRDRGLALLQSFLYERGEFYTKQMSSPNTAYTSCSRLSPHLAFGTLSIREVFQSATQRYSELKAMLRGQKSPWMSACRSFLGRLRWHCHFMQKLEDEPDIERFNLHPDYDQLRRHHDEQYFQAWCKGRTGFPMVDACMRALHETGWLNFRMRALVMSFSSYHLWLPWQRPAAYLASQFTDYEPGIHYSQVQMQSGTTGINSIRIYNPIKQGYDQDPQGTFIRHWIPELSDMETAYIHEPWQCPAMMNGYPLPIVDEKQARAHAASQLYPLRKNVGHALKSKSIVAKHASRKRKSPPRSEVKAQSKKITQIQGELPL